MPFMAKLLLYSILIFNNKHPHTSVFVMQLQAVFFQ